MYFYGDYSVLEYSDESPLSDHEFEESFVKAFMDRRQKMKDEGEFKAQEMSERTDRQAVISVREEQVKLLGGCELLYDKVHSNLKTLRFDPYFAKEQFKLYTWREEFFNAKFPDDTWYTDGADDSHSFDTIPYQISVLWDKLVPLACCPNKAQDGAVYLENDEMASHRAKMLFWENNYDEYGDSFLEEGISFSDMAHMVEALYSCAPPKLEQLALKACRVFSLPLEEAPASVQQKAVEGFWHGNMDPSPQLSVEGVEKFNSLKQQYYDLEKEMSALALDK